MESELPSSSGCMLGTTMSSSIISNSIQQPVTMMSSGGQHHIHGQQQQQPPPMHAIQQQPANNNNYVIVELHRDDVNCPSFGFNIKGGAETGCPVYIWRVEPGSLADRSGLKSGDEIVQANGISFGGITHAEALKVLKGQTTLTLYIKAPGGSPAPQPPPPPPPRSQRMMQAPGEGQPVHPSHSTPQPTPSHNLHHRVEYYTWVDRHGNPVPPPNAQDYPPERLINLDIAPGQNLGLMIRGGCEYGLGIYVTGVDPGSVAERVGLQRGDEILSVNSKNFTRITHDKAVQILKSSKHMQIVASYIGKIPADLNDEDLLKLDGAAGSGTDTSFQIGDDDDPIRESEIEGVNNVGREVESVDDEIERTLEDGELDLDFGRDRGADGAKRCTTSILQMIEEKARTVLNKSEHSRFTFYRIEYMQGFLPVVAFVRILLELLNTHEKYTLLTEVRELIRPVDLHQFDELIYNKSHSFRVSSAPSNMPTTVTSPQAVVATSPLPTSSIYPANNNNNALISSTAPTMLMSPQQNQSLVGGVMPGQVAPVPLPPPPNFMHCHPQLPPPQQQQQDLAPDEIVDDFIEHPVMGPVGNMNEMVLAGGDCGGGFGGPWRQQHNQNGVQDVRGNVVPGGVPQVPDSRQLLITHDPAALTMTHPQILNSGGQPSLRHGGTVATSIGVPASLSASTTTTTTTAMITPNRVANAVSQGGGSVNSNLIGATTTTTMTTTTTSASSSVPAVRFKVRITKVKPILGIAIEGGCNTPHRLPRIIDVNPDGSAFHSNLRAGQVLLTVDGKKLDGLSHEEIARLILDCYVDMTKSQIEFLVVEAKQNYYYFNTQQQNI